MGKSSTVRVEPDKLIQTIQRLNMRIEERFPGSSLGQVCSELLAISRRSRSVSERIGRPNVLLRLLATLFVLGLLGATYYAFQSVDLPDTSRLTLEQFVTLLEAGINDLLLMGAAIFFAVSVEGRIKRSRTLSALHELRSLAHIIDMHQLTKDPEIALGAHRSTASSPTRSLDRFELSRYLDYCSEMLSLAGKVAVLYVQSFPDSAAVAAVNEVEDLCTGLSRKVWQKLMILESRPAVDSSSQA